MPTISKVPSVVSLARPSAGHLTALALAAAVVAWGGPGVALAQAPAGASGPSARLAGVDAHRDRAAKTPSINASDIRIVLARTYLQTGGPKNIPLPTVSQLIGGKRVVLPPCPAAKNRSLSLNVAGADRAFSRRTLRRAIEMMREEGRIPRRGAFPYCAWWLPVDVRTLNIAFPDAAAVYWAMPLYVPAQRQVIITGTYPDARYISFAVYNQKLDPYQYTPPGSRHAINSYLADYQIRPDPGSLNPWRTPGAQPGGSYTITIKRHPRARERNALPLLQDPTASQSATRVSIPLPPPCGRSGAPACTLPGVFTSPPAEDQSSVFSNPDNTYLPAIIRPNQRNEVWVVRGKLPRTPHGESPVPWPNPRYQLRYWSMCTAIYARPYPTITNGGCLVDNDVVTDKKGFYTIVVSTGRARPSTATTQNGVNWLRVRPGVANLLIVRNMLGAGFPYSTQNVTKDGSWQTAYLSMRDYYPSITVQCTTAHYLASGWQGCVAPKGSGVIGGGG
ncbi:MAG TPA: hypothetical protein VE197_15840, partial [Mycobacterium sp.]|nr:hypothetical protein [Mycobacterium sp.]